MLLSTLLAAIARRTGLDLAWRITALGLAAVALVLAWLLRPRADAPADAILAAGLTAVAALLAASALAGRSATRSPAPLSACRGPSAVRAGSSAPRSWTLRTVVAARAA